MVKTKLSLTIAAVIVSAMPTGYRRAGIALDKGENCIEIDEMQLTQIEQDSNLLVQSIEPVESSTNNPAQGDLDNNGLGKSVTSANVDITGCDNNSPAGVLTEQDFTWSSEELAPFITAIHKLHGETPLTKKPNVDKLVVDVLIKPTGEDSESSDEVLPVKTTPSATQRDAAWQYYLDNVINHNPG